MRNVVILVAILLFYSCGENWKVGDKDKPVKHKNIPPVQVSEEEIPKDEIDYKEVITDQLIINEVYVGKFQKGDRLKIALKGEKRTPIFGPITVKSFEASWSEKICLNMSNYQCFDMPKTGRCKIRYREYGESFEPIQFGKNTASYRIKVKIGENFYPVGKVIRNNEDTVETSLKLTDEMLKSSTDLYLSVIADENYGNVNTGFLGFDICEGLGKPNFLHKGPTEMKLYKNQVRRTYKVNVWLAK